MCAGDGVIYLWLHLNGVWVVLTVTVMQCFCLN